MDEKGEMRMGILQESIDSSIFFRLLFAFYSKKIHNTARDEKPFHSGYL
jgi:hypothetical protein